MTRDLRALADYLARLGVTHVALEATGVLWKPVWNLLEGRFSLLLVHARHLKNCASRRKAAQSPITDSTAPGSAAMTLDMIIFSQKNSFPRL